MLKKSDKTKVLIRNTFIKLLNEKGLNDVSVKNITEELDINRGTFYLHYEDKYALLQEIEMDIINNIKSILENGAAYDLGGYILARDNDMLFNTLTEIYKYIKDSSHIIGVLIGPNGDASFQWKLKTLIEETLQKNLESQNLDNTIALKYMTVIASSAQLGIIQKWIKSDFQETPEELAIFMSGLINEVFHKVLINHKQ